MAREKIRHFRQPMLLATSKQLFKSQKFNYGVHDEKKSEKEKYIILRKLNQKQYYPCSSPAMATLAICFVFRQIKYYANSKNKGVLCVVSNSITQILHHKNLMWIPEV